jgi:hypothetical protein
MGGLLDAMPLLAGELAEDVRELEVAIIHELKPRGRIEELLARDVVYEQLEMMRLRRLKVLALRSSAGQGLFRLLEGTALAPVAADIVRGWLSGEAEAVAQVEALLVQLGVSEEAVVAQTAVVLMNELDRFDRAIGLSAARRNAALREIDRCREAQIRRRQAMETGRFSGAAAETEE